MAKQRLGALKRLNTPYWLGVILSCLLSPSLTNAQIVPDGTLGTQVSGVCAGAGGTCRITGTPRGSNLFHSFQRFSLPNGDTAAFITNPTIQNIIVRVTGGDISRINGTISTIDSPFTGVIPTNFFLLNPSGVVFGPNARILVGGSFLASTAERLLFQDGTVFSTRDQSVNPLLTVSVPVGLQLGTTPSSIQMEPRTNLSTTLGRNQFTTLTLVGGDISLDGTRITAPGQRVELAALADGGTVELKQTENTIQIGSLGHSTRANITLANQSGIRVSGGGNGDVSMYGKDITLSNNTSVATGIILGAGSTTSRSGDLLVEATGTVRLVNNSQIANLVAGVGDSGQVRISGQRLEFVNGSIVGSASVGLGSAGNVTITATESITFSGQSSNRIPSGVLSVVGLFDGFSGNGNGGDIVLQAPNILLRDSAQITNSNLSATGNAGNIRVEAPTQLSIENADIRASTSGIGNAGSIELVVGSLAMTNGIISASTDGRGNAGDITIVADSSTLSDGGIYSAVSSRATGSGGNITMQTGTLTLSNGAALSASTAGNGNAGNVKVSASDITLGSVTPNGQLGSGIFSTVRPGATGSGGDVTVQTRTLTVANGATLNASTFGNGDAGNVKVSANDIKLDGATPNGQFGSGIFSTVSSGAIGSGGDVTVQTDTLTVTNGAAVNASTAGNGDAGNIQVSANDIKLDGATPNGQFGSGIFSAVNPGAIGSGGDVIVQTGTLTVANGASVITGTFGNGNAGSVQVFANAITLDGAIPNGLFGSGIFSTVNPTATGVGGDVIVQTGTLTVVNGAAVTASTSGSGDAGNIRITADEIDLNGTTPNGLFSSGIFTASRSFNRAGDIFITTEQLRLSNQGVISAISAATDGGNINLNVGRLLLMRNRSLISAQAGEGGTGGNITINMPKGFIIGVKSEDSDIRANAVQGNGGRINITAQGIIGLQFRSEQTSFSDITASSTFGLNGVVTLNTPDVDPSRGLVQLPQNLIDTNRILANSCIVRNAATGGVFLITGTGGLPEQPETGLPAFAVGEVRGVEKAEGEPSNPPRGYRQEAEVRNEELPIAEAQGLYKLPDGQIILSWECPK